MKLTTKQYAEILDEAVARSHKDSLSHILKEFAETLSKDGKISKLNDILAQFNTLWNKRHQSVDVLIETADGSDVEIPHTLADKKVIKKIKSTPHLIGGSVIKIGDYIIDNSIYSKINALRK